MKKLIVVVVTGVAMAIAALTYTGDLTVWECPFCGAKASEMEICSYNTFGAVFWSDGFWIAPQAPSQDCVSRCWKCKKVFAKWEAKNKSIPEEKVPKADSRSITWIGDYSALKAILDTREGKLKPQQECALRWRMLWAANHQYRKTNLDADDRLLVEDLKVEKIPVAEIQENMLKLSSMTNLPTWLRIEVLREMGNFEAARKMMDEFAKSNPEDFKEGGEFFKAVLERIKKKDAKVFKR